MSRALVLAAGLPAASLRATPDEPAAAPFRSAFEAQFPKSEATAAAIELEKLAAGLGIDLVPEKGHVTVAEEPPAGETIKPPKITPPQRIDRDPPTQERLDELDQTMGLRKLLTEIAGSMRGAADPVALCREFFGLYLKQFFVRPEAIARRRGSSFNAPADGVRNYFVVNQATLASLGDYNLRPVLSRLTVPAMVIEGAASIPSTVESARVLAQSLPGASLVLVPDAGHFPQVERPDLFFPAVERFLSEAVRDGEKRP